MTDQLIIEPEARLLVELGQERGVVYEDELAGLSLELDLDADDVQTLRGWYRNRVARVLLNFFLTSLGTAIGVWVGGAKMLGRLLG